jgi:hypothetical protein
MTVKQTNSKTLQKALERSAALPMLIPAYQRALRNLALSGDRALQRAASLILRQERPDELQSVYFTERLLSEFVAVNFPSLPAATVLRQYRQLATRLIQAFLFFSAEDKAKILPSIDRLDLPALLKMIQLYREGHRKQLEYLQIMAEKDPKMGTKFRVLVEQATRPQRKKTI